jgi:hypothetical protein
MVHRTVQVPAQQRVSLNIAGLGMPPGPSSIMVDGVNEAQFYDTQSMFTKNGTDGSEVTGIDVSGQ